MCYNTNSRFACLSATVYCNTQTMGPLMRKCPKPTNSHSFTPSNPLETGFNPYYVRRKCDRSEDADGLLCYRQIRWILGWTIQSTKPLSAWARIGLLWTSCSLPYCKTLWKGIRCIIVLLSSLSWLMVVCGSWSMQAMRVRLSFLHPFCRLFKFSSGYDMQLYGAAQSFFETNSPPFNVG